MKNPLHKVGCVVEYEILRYQRVAPTKNNLSCNRAKYSVFDELKITIQQQLQPPLWDLGFDNIDKVDSSGFDSSQAMSRLIGVNGGVSPIRWLANEHKSPHVVKVSFILWLTVSVSPLASQW